MNKELRRQIADYFTPAELIDFVDINVEELIEALLDYDESLFDEEVLEDIKEIMDLDDE